MIRLGVASRLVGVMLVTLLFAGCGGGGGSKPSATPAAASGGAPPAAISVASYKLGSGDRIKITVFQHEDLSGEFALDGAGNFAMPLIGEMKGYGLTTRELEKSIEQRLGDGYIVDPQVSIEVLNYRPFYILGEVRNPGSYPYVNGMTIAEAVALAGGFSYRANQDEFELQRGGSNSGKTEVAVDAGLLPGDIVTVKERFF